jgi:ribonuclease HI
MPNKEKKKKQYYLVVAGRKPGIYRQWSGGDGAAEQVQGYPKAVYRGFHTLEAAAEWLRGLDETLQTGLPPEMAWLLKIHSKAGEPAEDPETVIIYTDGSAIRNPGPGGYGVVLKHKGRRKELSGGEPHTTNNRMELTACITALRALKQPGKAVLYSDSRYVVESINKGWARRWKEKGWLRSGSQPVENQDLWDQLLVLLDKHSVEFHWTRGHAGHPDNERCDQLALAAAKKAARQAGR